MMMRLLHEAGVRWQVSLKTRMTVAVTLLAAALVLATGWSIFQFFRQDLQQSISSQQFTLVSALAEEVDGKIRTAREHLAAIAGMVPPAALADPARARAFLEGQHDNQLLFDSGIFFFAPDGNLLAAVPAEPSFCRSDCPFVPWVRKTAAEKRPLVSEPFFLRHENPRPVVAFSAPVLGPDGEVRAVLAGALDLLQDNFLGHLAEVRLGKGGYLYLYNQQRTLIVHPNRDRILKRDVPPGVNRMFDRALEGFEGSGETVTSRGLHALSSFKRLPTTGWILAANLPVVEAYAPVERAQRSFLLVLAATLLATPLAVWGLMRRLTAPLQRLSRQVGAFGAGAPPASVRVEERDEIGALADAFNQMVARLAGQEQALKGQLHFLQVLVDAMPNPIFFKDAAGRYLGCNRAFAAYIGIGRDDLVGKTVYDLAPPDLAEVYHRTDAELFGRGPGQVQTYESSVLYADGSRRPVIFFKATFPDPDGRLGGLVGTILDISDRKRAEEEAQEQRRFSERLLESAAAAAFVLDAEHRVLAWNPACEALTGVRAAEVLGTGEHWRAFYDHRRPCLADFALSRSLDGLAASYADVRRSDLVPEGLVAEGWLMLNGRRRYIVFNAAPIRNGGGRLLAAIETLEDITERKLAEESLERSLDQLRKISLAVEQSPNIVVITDAAGAIEYVNPRFCAVTGYSPAEAVGQNPRILKAGDTPEEYYRTLWETVTAGREWRGEFHNRKKSGESFWESAQISPLKNAEGVITHFVAVKEEITARKTAERRQRLSAQVLTLLSLPSGRADKIRDILPLLRELTGCEAVGIRLREKADYPYYRTLGLGEDLLAAENFLLSGDDAEIADCLCGKVLLGRTDPALPWFTPGGSFWVGAPDGAESGVGAAADSLCGRGRCLNAGFRSLALIPLRAGEEVIGLVQVMDRQAGRLTIDLVQFLETLGTGIGIALEHRQTEERLLEKESRLHFLSNYDPLTRLPNRALLCDRLQHAMAKAERSGKKVALLLLDLDRFKTINDSLGHELGDRLLCQVAERLRQMVRESDTLARFSGDEFAVILEDVEDLKQVTHVGRKILGQLSEVITLEGYPLYLTASIGISLCPGDADDLESLLKYAEVAMYRAKESGRNSCQFYRPEMNARGRELLILEGSLRQALEKEQLVLFYQPKVELASGRVTGVEALLRWRHPDLGMVSPADFIPLAEETGLIVPIGEWVLQTACAQARAWQQAGLPPLRMAVNISGRQFRQDDFVDMVERVLAQTGLDPEGLELEITESVVMENVEETIMTLTDLKVRGLRLAVDDFGTGYSSLSYLKRFPISTLKIDRSFIREVVASPHDAAIATSVIALARVMGLQVVAEGIETEEQRRFLVDQGCAEGQGFLFSRPVPAGELERLLAAWPDGKVVFAPC